MADLFQTRSSDTLRYIPPQQSVTSVSAPSTTTPATQPAPTVRGQPPTETVPSSGPAPAPSTTPLPEPEMPWVYDPEERRRLEAGLPAVAPQPSERHQAALYPVLAAASGFAAGIGLIWLYKTL